MRQHFLRASLAALLVASSPATAAYVDVSGFWSVGPDLPNDPIPAGISISCYGSATAHGDPSTQSGGCGGRLSLNTTVTSTQSFDVSSTGGLVVTNTTNHSVTGQFILYTAFSAFNPGGPEVGISIDNPLTEAGDFRSSVTGEGVGDFHSCSVGILGNSGSMFSSTTCGVDSPDSSQETFGVNVASLAAGASMDIPYMIDISASFIDPDPSVPEPTSLLLLATALGGLSLCFLRKTNDRA